MKGGRKRAREGAKKERINIKAQVCASPHFIESIQDLSEHSWTQWIFKLYSTVFTVLLKMFVVWCIFVFMFACCAFVHSCACMEM